MGMESQMTFVLTPVYSVDKLLKTKMDGGINISRTIGRRIRRQSLVMDKENACMLDFTQIGQAYLPIRIVIDWG